MEGRATLSLGWRTELAFARFDGEVVDEEDCIVVRTPSNPTFWWGNHLLLRRAPREGEASHWLARFDAAIRSRQPASMHLAIGVDTVERVELPADLASIGATLTELSVLELHGSGEPVRGGPTPGRFAIVDLEADGHRVVDKQVAVDEHRFGTTGYREFAAAQVARQAAMSRAGLGCWFGWWVDGVAGPALAASCGLFACDVGEGRRVGRFQYVTTHPAWRRRGFCRALVAAACLHGRERMGLEALVMMADPHDVAIGIYESLGFRRTGRAWQIERAPSE